MQVSQETPQPRLWTGPFIGVMVVNAAIALNFLLLMTYMTGYAVNRFGVGEAEAGLAAGVFVFGALIARVFVGKYTDVIGRKRMLVISVSILLLGSIGYFFANHFVLLLVVRIMQGAAFGSVSNLVNTMAMSMIPASRRGEGTGWFTLSLTLGQALGPALGLWLVTAGDHNAVFAFGVGLSLIAALVSFLLPTQEVTVSETQQIHLRSWRLDRILEPNALPMGLLALLLALPYSGILTFMNGYATEVGLLEFASVFFIVYAVSLAVSRPIGGSLLDRYSDNAVVLPAFVPYLLALLLLALDLGVIGFFASAVLIAFGYGLLISLLQSIAVRDTPTPRTSMAISTFYIGLDTGMGIGPILLGTVVGLGVAYRELFGLLVGLIIAIALVYVLVHGRKPSARTSPGSQSAE
ncbi:MAG: MFS transporter [Gulosibacter sp.]|uniref:MFS transporter n=1 Tax=Gulosibacter sp. TaxID=2817531 RepID=UPI003F90891D